MADMALAGLRWAASPIINKLLADASTYLGVDMARELQELEATVLPQFDLVIEAAEKSPHRDKLKAWLRQLKEAFYDAEDLLDDHEHNILKRKAKSEDDSSEGDDASSSIKSTILKPFRDTASRARNLLPENKRLIRKLKELKDILVKAKDFRELLGLPAGNNFAAGPSVATAIVPPTTSLQPPKVFGRDMDRDRVIDLLTKRIASPGVSYSGVAIVGHGGTGKSTLAQYVYNDGRVKDHFDVRMWVCISRKLDVYRHTRELINSATNAKCPRLDNIDTLQCRLRDTLQKSERFLLVLDDVWFEASSNESEWDLLLEPLVSQKEGSKVLVTSRRDTFPAALRCQEEVIRLEDLKNDEFLSLFRHHAFSGAEIGDQRLKVQLEEIGEKIAKLLGKSPLAAKVVGSQLSRKKDITSWRGALGIKISREPMKALLWSYEKLDPRVQRCFSYCSLFPKGHRYHIHELVPLWVAEGLVENSCNHNGSIEDVGQDYINDLISGSFFQPVYYAGKQTDTDVYTVTMHDFLHDLAESLSREDCLILNDDEAEIPITVRHLSVRVVSKGLPVQFCNLRKLRHLKISGGGEGTTSIPNIGRLTSVQRLLTFCVKKQKGYELHQLRKMNELRGTLRITNLEAVTGKEEALGAALLLKRHLNYLALVWTVENDSQAEDSKHLEILEGLMPPPQLNGIKLEGYKSSSYPSWLLEPYFESLVSFELGNCLVLEGLPHDTSILRHCSCLRLYNIPNLKTLPCLPAGLVELTITQCPLLIFITNDELQQHGPTDNPMGTNDLASQLASLWEVDSGSSIRSVLSAEHSSMKQQLMVASMDGDVSENLQTIKSAVEEGKDKVLAKESIINAWLYCHEQRIGLILGRSTELLLAPAAKGITLLFLSSCGITNGALASCLGGLSSLWRFSLRKIMNLTTLPSEEAFQHLTKLEAVTINDCWCLRSLGGLRAAASVSYLELRSCPSLDLARGAEYMPLFLGQLVIGACMVAADSLSNGLPRLVKLHIFNSWSSASLSIGHLTSLESLSICGLQDLCFLEGLSSLQLLVVSLRGVPKLTAECISQFRVQKSLSIDSPVLLSHMLSSEDFIVPAFLILECWKEPSFSFDESKFSSVERLSLTQCEMKSLPGNLKCLSSLKILSIRGCPNISSLPDLPCFLQNIEISGCELLKESCRAPDGECWPKIAHIRWKEIN
ncbi:hypothetical protein HU200_051212 [Digitaria exilis]|uniref:Rp1-like protein n=1 Tax=Digitaria exilis TaxID=1010633 RepID=A0A835AVZ7_9POAL|nr:hypothetical protein HU200_051212 [Digitaria exilis]